MKVDTPPLINRIECRADTPIPDGRYPHNNRGYWPIVEGDDWCRQFDIRNAADRR